VKSSVTEQIPAVNSLIEPEDEEAQIEKKRTVVAADL